MSVEIVTKKRVRRALVLSGGGARGAYEAGVLRYIQEVLPDDLGEAPRLDIISGTSVGAINAAWLAATLDDPQDSVRRLCSIWRRLIFSQTVQPSYRDAARAVRRMLWDRAPVAHRPRRKRSREGGLFRTTFFDEIIGHEIPFNRIGDNLAKGVIESLSVSATNIITGQTTVFVQSSKPVPPWTRDKRRVALSGPITARKVLASAAIPLLFPAVQIDDHWYSDGGLRQNTPISPALRLGADRLLVIALKRSNLGEEEERVRKRVDYGEAPGHPNPTYVLGKFLDALLLDPLDYDLNILERINGILEYGGEAFGEDIFMEKLNEVIRAHRGQGYRVVHPLLLRPSQDMGELASRFARQQRADFWGSLPLRMLADRALADEGARESDLLSYLLFDGDFTGQLIDMGYKDAMARHDELVEFFSD